MRSKKVKRINKFVSRIGALSSIHTSHNIQQVSSFFLFYKFRMNFCYTLKDMVSFLGSLRTEYAIGRIFGRGEIQSKLSTSSVISSPICGSDILTFNCQTLYDEDGRPSLNLFGITISFTMKNYRNSFKRYVNN